MTRIWPTPPFHQPCALTYRLAKQSQAAGGRAQKAVGSHGARGRVTYRQSHSGGPLQNGAVGQGVQGDDSRLGVHNDSGRHYLAAGRN